MNAIKIPVVIGKNRLRGKAEGAMVFDDCGQENLDTLRGVLRKEADRQGGEFLPGWMSTSVAQLLSMYERAYQDWQAKKSGTVGFIYECWMPSGQILLFGEPRILEKAILSKERYQEVQS